VRHDGIVNAKEVADRLEDGPCRLVSLARDSARRGDREEAKRHLVTSQQLIAELTGQLAGSPHLETIREAMTTSPPPPSPDPAAVATAESAFDFALDQTLGIYDHLVAALRRLPE
jgi:hypothetical protein